MPPSSGVSSTLLRMWRVESFDAHPAISVTISKVRPGTGVGCDCSGGCGQAGNSSGSSVGWWVSTVIPPRVMVRRARRSSFGPLRVKVTELPLSALSAAWKASVGTNKDSGLVDGCSVVIRVVSHWSRLQTLRRMPSVGSLCTRMWLSTGKVHCLVRSRLSSRPAALSALEGISIMMLVLF